MHGGSNVVSLRANELPGFGLASVSGTGQPLSGSRNSVWLCPAFTSSYAVMLYVKPQLSVRQVVAELLCAQIALALELPCPRPYLVNVAPHNVGLPRGQAKLTFGCEQVGARSAVRVIRDLDVLFEAMARAKALSGTCVMDEWIANGMRHERDVVYDPRGAVWLIDHEAALPGDVAPDEAVVNWLADRLRERTEHHKHPELLVKLRRHAGRPQVLALPTPPAEMLKVEGAQETWYQVVAFLKARLEHLDYLLSRRVMPEQAYLKATEGPGLTDTAAHGAV